MIEITRSELVRILGEEKVSHAESLSSQEFEEQKWENLDDLLTCYEKVTHKNLFEARRSYITGLNPKMQTLLVCHIFDMQKASTLV